MAVLKGHDLNVSIEAPIINSYFKFLYTCHDNVIINK